MYMNKVIKYHIKDHIEVEDIYEILVLWNNMCMISFI